MTSISGYAIHDKIYEGSKSIVYRAEQEKDHKQIILKTLKHPYPHPRDIAKLRREYEIGQQINVPGLITPDRLERHGNRLWLVLSDYGGNPSHHFIATFKEDIAKFIDFALQTTTSLSGLHDSGIIHCDIKPSNILVNPQTRVVRLIDLGLSTRIVETQQEINHPSMVEGTLAYISPERTGRLTLGSDHRTDFYSLGATFFHLVTGQLPFDTTDPMELVHCHIARLPMPPRILNPVVPECLSNIILKLMEKTAEHRYQSSRGLQADLLECQNQWKKQQIIIPFSLGTQDRSEQFIIPKKLYGRETEQKVLLQTLGKIREETIAVGLTFVAGSAGVGKSALISEIQSSMVMERCYFIAGKFDQLQRNVPYASLLQAFQGLVRQILGESEESIDQWQQSLNDALGSYSNVIIDVIPELELIIGRQAELKTLSPTEAQNRFRQAFCQFIGVFSQHRHPLILFLDDIQWADNASLSLLKDITLSPLVHHVMIVMAYRDEEVIEGHPFQSWKQELMKKDLDITLVHLMPLDEQAVNQLVADTFTTTHDACQKLSRLLNKKSKGNPFFLKRLLSDLFNTQLIQNVNGQWTWNISSIENHNIPDDIVSLVINELQRLPKNAQKVLMLAACINGQFDLATLVTISEQSTNQVAKDLDLAILHNLITPLVSSHRVIASLAEEEVDLMSDVEVKYRFLHDRIQQAAYAMLTDEQQRAEVHLRIGRLLLAECEERDPNTTAIFNLASQLNYGQYIIADLDERLNCARLNLEAGKKAKASVAYDIAHSYIQFGIRFLPHDGWSENYSLTFSLHKELLECQYLCQDIDAAKKTFDLLINHARNQVEAAEIYGLFVILCTSLGQFSEAVELCHKGLRNLGWKVPVGERQVRWAVRAELLSIQRRLIGCRITELIHHPELKDPVQLAKLNLMAQLIPTLYYTDMESSNLFYLKMANLSLQYGNAPMSSVAYLGLGRFLGERLGQNQQRFELGQLAIQLLDKFNSRELRCKSLFLFGGFIHPWTRSSEGDLKYLRDSYQAGVDSGDLNWACYANNVLTMRLLFLGKNLAEIEAETSRCLRIASQVGESYTPFFLRITYQVARCLQAKTLGAADLSDEDFNEQMHLDLLRSRPELIGALNWYYVAKTLVCLINKDSDTALRMALMADKTISSATGLCRVADHTFYLGLSLAANDSSNQDAAIQRQRRKRLYGCYKDLADWARHNPSNFQHKALLIAAELESINGRFSKAAQLYKEAIQAAQESAFIHCVALANERASQFYAHYGFEVASKAHQLEARYAYMNWNAFKKADQLVESTTMGDRRLDQLQNPYRIDLMESSSSVHDYISQHGYFDFYSVIKATQTLSGEIFIDKLLAKMIQLLLENAGAQRVVLILTGKAQPMIAAEGWSDRPQVEVLSSRPMAETDNLPKSIINLVLRTKETVLLADAAEQHTFRQDPYLSLQHSKSILCTPLITKGKLIGCVYLENNLVTNAFTEARMEAIHILSTQLAISIENASLYTDLAASNVAYGRFIPHEFLHFLERDSIMDIQLGDQILKQMTVMFADIRDFTSISERLTPQQSFNFLNAYLRRAGPVIRNHNGFIDKYIGDAVMALFPGNADDAIHAAIQLQKEVSEFNLELEEQGLQSIKIGIGIHTGNLMLGTIGERERMETTVISDAVNLADRIQDLTKVYGNSIIITSNTLRDLSIPIPFNIRNLGHVQIRGKENVVEIYDVFNADTDTQVAKKISTRSLFEHGVKLFHLDELDDAMENFSTVLRSNPEDAVALCYLTLCQHKLAGKIPL